LVAANTTAASGDITIPLAGVKTLAQGVSLSPPSASTDPDPASSAVPALHSEQQTLQVNPDATATPTVAAAVPASDGVERNNVGTAPVVAEQALEAKEHAAPAPIAEQNLEQPAVPVEPTRVSVTRLMLEELPQLVEEDFNTQESIFTTLANRSASLFSPHVHLCLPECQKMTDVAHSQ
jgi:hypothetical protein